MCQVCAIAARYPHSRQDSLVFNLSQFAAAVEVKPTELINHQSVTPIQENNREFPKKQ